MVCLPIKKVWLALLLAKHFFTVDQVFTLGHDLQLDDRVIWLPFVSVHVGKLP